MQNTVVQIGNFSYLPNKIIGQGASGSVYLGFRNKDQFPVAVKAINLKEINTKVKKHLLNCEVSALQNVRNRYVCQAYDILKDNEFYFIPQEYCPNGTLRNYIKNKGKLSSDEIFSLFSKILEGYSAIRASGFIHRDLKPDNILLKQNNDPLIIDFGYCERQQTQNTKLCYNVGSPGYMSPEAFRDCFYSQKSDIWALGIVLHQMITNSLPIMRTKNVNQYFGYLSTMKNAEIKIEKNNAFFYEIVNRMLTVSLNQRICLRDLVKSFEQQSKRMANLNMIQKIPFGDKTSTYCNSLQNQKNQRTKEKHGIQICGSYGLGQPSYLRNKNSKKNNHYNTQNPVIQRYQSRPKNSFSQQKFSPSPLIQPSSPSSNNPTPLYYSLAPSPPLTPSPFSFIPLKTQRKDPLRNSMGDSFRNSPIISQRIPLRQNLRSTIGGSIQSPSIQPLRNLSRDPSRQPFRQYSRQPIREQSIQPLRESFRQPFRDLSREPIRDPLREPLRVPLREPIREPSREPLRDSLRNSIGVPQKSIRLSDPLSFPNALRFSEGHLINGQLIQKQIVGKAKDNLQGNFQQNRNSRENLIVRDKQNRNQINFNNGKGLNNDKNKPLSKSFSDYFGFRNKVAI